MSLFISFEGGEGTGKTTQAKLLYKRLQQAGHSVLLVHEPGTTPLGNYLRDWLKRKRKKETVSDAAEVLLFAAARAELVAKVIKPTLKRPYAIVIADRYADSTTAYQGYGRRIPLKYVETINRLATQDVMPKLTFLLDCSPEEGLRRARSAQVPLERSHETAHARIDEEGTRRFEEEPINFHQRLRQGYLTMAQKEPERWCIIDATLPVDLICEIVWDRVLQVIEPEITGGGHEPDDLKLLSPQ